MILSNRQKRYLAGWGVIIVVGALISVLTFALAGKGTTLLTPGVTVFLIILLSTIAILSNIPWWRSLDEMQKDAQLAAWYWGGTTGVVMGVLCALLFGGAQSELVRGALLVGGCQVVCFSVVWLGWRFIHRAQAS